METKLEIYFYSFVMHLLNNNTLILFHYLVARVVSREVHNATSTKEEKESLNDAMEMIIFNMLRNFLDI